MTMFINLSFKIRSCLRSFIHSFMAIHLSNSSSNWSRLSIWSCLNLSALFIQMSSPIHLQPVVPITINQLWVININDKVINLCYLLYSNDAIFDYTIVSSIQNMRIHFHISIYMDSIERYTMYIHTLLMRLNTMKNMVNVNSSINQSSMIDCTYVLTMIHHNMISIHSSNNHSPKVPPWYITSQ